MLTVCNKLKVNGNEVYGLKGFFLCLSLSVLPSNSLYFLSLHFCFLLSYLVILFSGNRNKKTSVVQFPIHDDIVHKSKKGQPFFCVLATKKRKTELNKITSCVVFSTFYFV